MEVQEESGIGARARLTTTDLADLLKLGIQLAARDPEVRVSHTATKLLYDRLGKLAASILYANHHGLHSGTGYELRVTLKDGRTLQGPISFDLGDLSVVDMEVEQDGTTETIQVHESQVSTVTVEW